LITVSVMSRKRIRGVDVRTKIEGKRKDKDKGEGERLKIGTKRKSNREMTIIKTFTNKLNKDLPITQGPIYWKIPPPPWGGGKNISRCHLREKI
jgi:hypothetical protein